MKLMNENGGTILSIFLTAIIGILLLADPATYAIVIIRVAGILVLALGLFDILKYFRTSPEEAAEGSALYSGLTLLGVGCFCVFGASWFIGVFPTLAVIYGLLQIILGFRKLQRTVDALRLRRRLWYLRAIGAGVTLVFGFVIVFHPNMTMVSVWVFTGITLIIEAIIDGVFLAIQARSEDGK